MPDPDSKKRSEDRDGRESSSLLLPIPLLRMFKAPEKADIDAGGMIVDDHAVQLWLSLLGYHLGLSEVSAWLVMVSPAPQRLTPRSGAKLIGFVVHGCRLPEPWGLMPTPLALWPKSEAPYLLGCNISIVGAFVLYGELGSFGARRARRS